jgi:hypothetical protein
MFGIGVSNIPSTRNLTTKAYLRMARRSNVNMTLNANESGCH